MVSTMRCRLLAGLVALATQQPWVSANFLGAPGASNFTITANMTQAANMTQSRPRRGDTTTTITTTTSKPLFPASEMVGSVDQDDTALTLTVIIEGMESAMEKFKKANSALAKMTCAQLDDHREEMDKAWDVLKEQSLTASFNSAKANAIKSLEIVGEKNSLSKSQSSVGEAQAAETKAARKAQADYESMTILHLNVLEQYALKCGVKDKWCAIGDTGVNDKFGQMVIDKKQVDSKFTEAGWLRHQANAEFATTGDKKSADLRWAQAMSQVGKVWTDTSSIKFGLEVQTAACGVRPPPGVWATPPKKCNLHPSDPVMQALLRDDPKEFVRQWKEMIGAKAGLSPDKVTVDIAGCF